MFTLANNSGQWKLKKDKNYISNIVPKSLYRIRQDIKTWNNALNLAKNVESPKRYPLYNLYDEVLIDLHVSSQINNRKLQTINKVFTLFDKKGNELTELTNELQFKQWVTELNRAIAELPYFGHSLVELSYNDKGELSISLLPRQNVEPTKGILYLDYTDDSKKNMINYRELREYGTFILEFGKPNDIGLLNGIVPHALFKRFAQSCWSELCEIYGIPPRVMKTNTQDPTMVSRAKQMMTDMGTAAWFIIDDSENFEFAKGVDTNGDVYKNLIQLCNNEISIGISGAVIGQDTKNGSNSKEQTSITLLEELINADLGIIENAWNTTVIPALTRLGILPEGTTYKYNASEDIEGLWAKTKEAMPYLDVDVEWIKNKFGIEVKAKQTNNSANGKQTELNLGADFFV